jgi:hypothetical protein
MVGIAGDVAGVCALHLAGGMREAVPDGFALAVFAPGAFDLIGGGGCSPNKFVGKLERRETRLGLEKFADEAMAGRQDRKRCSGTKSGGEKFTAIEAISSAHGLPPRLLRSHIRMGCFGPAAK